MDFSRSDITIEKVHYHDLKDLEKIFTKEFGEEVGTDLIRQRIHRVRQFYYFLRPLSNLSAWIRNLFNIYIFRVKGNVAGFIQVSSLNSQQLHLDYIAVSKQYRGRGLGTIVLRTLLENVADPNNYDVILEVRIDNPAYNLYKRLGFSSQAQVLHYERNFGGPNDSVLLTSESQLEGLRRLRAADRPLLYKLYRASVSRRLQRAVRREYREFNPSLFIRNMDWLKNYLMRNEKREYVVEFDGRIIASLDLRSYPKAKVHIISLILHPKHEELREKLMEQALAMLQHYYRQGIAATTIYDDAVQKQQTLEKLSFVQREAYHLMVRPPRAGIRKVLQPTNGIHSGIHGRTVSSKMIRL